MVASDSSLMAEAEVLSRTYPECHHGAQTKTLQTGPEEALDKEAVDYAFQLLEE